MNLSITEKRVVAIMLIAGRINRHEFNTLCNCDGINKIARDAAIKEIEDSTALVDAVYPLE